MSILSKREWTFLAVIFVFSFVPTFGGLVRIVELSGGPAIAPGNPRAVGNPVPITLHILSSLVFCLAGALQLVPSLRQNARGLHRGMGRLVAFAGCLSAATGLWMTLFFNIPQDLQGAVLYWARIFLGMSMIGLIIQAIAAARSRNFTGHSAAMIRAYAIGQGASTQVILGITGIAVLGTEPMGPGRDAMMVFAWVLNLLVAEVVIRTLFPSRRRPA